MSSSESVYHWSDTLSVVYATSISVIGILLNTVILYIITSSTPSSMKTYSIVIRVGVVCDLLFSITTFMVTTRVFVTGQTLIAIFQGFCTLLYYISQNRFITLRTCLYMNVSQFHSFLFSQYVLLYSYIHRYFVITKPYKEYNQFRVQLGCSIFTIIFIIYFNYLYHIYTTHGNLKEIDAIVEVVRPELINSTRFYSGIARRNDGILALSHLFSNITALNVVLVACFCSFKISRSLGKINASQTSRTMQKSLLNVLRVQTVSPLVEIITVVLSVLTFHHPELQSPFMENMILFPMITTCMITPVVTLFFIRPYRIAFHRLLGLKNSSVIASSGNDITIVEATTF